VVTHGFKNSDLVKRKNRWILEWVLVLAKRLLAHIAFF